MANEIKVDYQGADQPYVLIRAMDGTVAHAGDEAFEAWDNGNITDYAMDLASLGGGLWARDMPAWVNPGLYSLTIRTRSGAATVSDTTLVEDEINWGGAGEIPPSPTTSTAGMTRLRAVNEILEAIGEFPVNGLDTGGSSEAAQAERILDEVSEKIQSQGWHQNTEYNVTLARDNQSRVPLGSDILSIDADPNFGLGKNYGRRGTWLFDLDNRVYTFDSDPVVVRVVRLEFSDLLPSLKAYIVAEAKIRAQRAIQGSRTQDALFADEVVKARAMAHREDSRNADHNILTNPMARRTLGRRNIPLALR